MSFGDVSLGAALLGVPTLLAHVLSWQIQQHSCPWGSQQQYLEVKQLTGQVDLLSSPITQEVSVKQAVVVGTRDPSPHWC